ncbi:MAG: endonuclease/exonuclease/phosphatase family protein [Bacteroidetes bacterium]|nr:endonuclease/exonuclease/phosphatase family protein [Bacteroidota bacterium]
MSYNIRYDNPGDGDNAWNNRKEKLSGLILKESPDLLGVQEALKNQMDDLGRLLPGYESIGAGRDDGVEAGEFSAVFYKITRYERLDGNTFWLSQTPDLPGSLGWDAVCTRIVTWVKLKDVTNGKLVFFFNTHFDHMGKIARIKSARLLREKIKEIAENEAVVVTGDFNCPTKSKPMRILTRKFSRLKLRSCGSIATVRSGPDFSYSTFYVNGQHKEVIDHILISPAFLVKTFRILDDHEEGRYFSDHLPVVVVMKIK